eukprot:GFKZ01006393.1.p1 GENE.GFKZ01006393.1~~GFKZ01006393.1.p1  ORF type:complete len:588 (-),score=101.65 GFKZ01006393.1:114-1877(-)
MESLFIQPDSLPGGREWNSACADLVEESAREALRCDVSPTFGLFQVLFLLCVYGGILFRASKLIADGSELLLLVPSLRHIVGSVVLPILGAVPDGAIVFFSGLGPNAQETLAVGVGALAGSTSMLLTVPWFLSVLAGRVSIRDGKAFYRQPKLQPPGDLSLVGTGVVPNEIVSTNGFIMLITAIPYLVIQGAAFLSGNFIRVEQTPDGTRHAADFEKTPAMFCFIVCFTFFFGYLWFSAKPSGVKSEYEETYLDELRLNFIRAGYVSLSAAVTDITAAVHDADETTGLVDDGKKKRLEKILHVFFHQYDRDKSNTIDKMELQNLMRDMGEKIGPEQVSSLYNRMDLNGDGRIEFEEFRRAIPEFIRERAQGSLSRAGSVAIPEDVESLPAHESSHWPQDVGRNEEEEEEEEEEEVPDDLRDLDPDDQIRIVKRRAFSMMMTGTTLVLIFSDPMVSVMSDFGRRIGIPAFYISFILAPLASNASELLAAYSYALKKTRKTVTISFATLLGAAIMNNTFVLSIFMLLIVSKGLAWQFSAETIAIVVVEICMYFMAQKKILTLRDGLWVLSLFPVSIGIVAFLENVVGLD